MPHFSFIGPLENPLKRALDDEGAQAGRIALLLLLEIGPGEDEEVVGDVGERDPALLAGEHVAIALLDRRRLDAARVAAGGRLGQAVAGDLRALRLRHEIALLLILGAPREQRQAVQAGVHRHDHAQRRVDVFELLAGEAERRCSPCRRRRTPAAPRCRAARASPCRRGCGRDRSGAARSCSRMRGATSRAPHSRTDCSSRRCSSVRVKSIMIRRRMRSASSDVLAKRRIVSRAAGDVHGRAAAQTERRGGARAVGGDLEMVGAAEQRADLAGAPRRRRSRRPATPWRAADLRCRAARPTSLLERAADRCS